MLKNYNNRFVYVISALINLSLICSCSGVEEKEYVYYNYCEDWQNTTTESILCQLDRGVVMSVNVSKSEVNVVTFGLPPVDPIAILFDQKYCTNPKGAVSDKLFYSFLNAKPSAADNDGVLETKRKVVIKRPSILEPSTIYIGIEGEHEFNTLCLHLSVGSGYSHSYGSTFHVSKEGISIKGEVSGNEARYLTIYNPERKPISAQLFQITFSNITIGGFYSFTKKDPDASNNDGVLNTNNDTIITWPSSYSPALYLAIENVKEIEGNSTFLLYVKFAQETPGFWARWFGWLG